MIQSIKESIKEFFNPELKCKRIGHDEKERSIKIRKDATLIVVVEDYKAKIKKCSRCNEILGEPYDLEYLQGIHSCGMPSEDWDRIREDGYLILKYLQ